MQIEKKSLHNIEETVSNFAFEMVYYISEK